MDRIGRTYVRTYVHTQDDGDSNERCDSRFFLVDLADPDGIWREGPSFPGECGLGQTMDTVNFTRGHGGGSAGESQVRVRSVIPARSKSLFVGGVKVCLVFRFMRFVRVRSDVVYTVTVAHVGVPCTVRPSTGGATCCPLVLVFGV